MRPLLRRPAAAAAVLAALLAVSACGSSHSSGNGKNAAGASSGPVPARSVPDAQTEPDTPSPPASLSAPLPRASALPDAQLTPATGTFGKRDKAYLSGRVPKNMDPAAVLQTGQETCQRVSRTAAHDRDAAVGAVIAGDIPDAQAAITHLCPDQLPVLEAAEAGFPDGTRKKPAAGRYRALTTDPNCTWRATGKGGKLLASGPSTGAEGPVEARIPAGAEEFTSSGCYAWLSA
ncbi:hypothetical protein OG204_32645 [Streptomyces sp. NBC_01387]|uniref:hypothetical protein n=1 Tax=Streptomyces sp. NBC_01387 TaxID=2903849 RepID=UPI00324C80BB